MALEKKIYHIAILASGTGSNAKSIIEYLKAQEELKVKLLLSNKESSGIFKLATQNEIVSKLFTRSEFKDETCFLEILEDNQIDFIILAGFLWHIPDYLVEKYENKIINIHPSLLPKYGGKGMYGMNVHRAVFENEEEETGLTIHLVNQHYDEGEILFQHQIDVSVCKSAEGIAAKVLEQEHKYFPKVIAKYILSFKET